MITIKTILRLQFMKAIFLSAPGSVRSGAAVYNVYCFLQHTLYIMQLFTARFPHADQHGVPFSPESAASIVRRTAVKVFFPSDALTMMMTNHFCVFLLPCLRHSWATFGPSRYSCALRRDIVTRLAPDLLRRSPEVSRSPRPNAWARSLPAFGQRNSGPLPVHKLKPKNTPFCKEMSTPMKLWLNPDHVFTHSSGAMRRWHVLFSSTSQQPSYNAILGSKL